MKKGLLTFLLAACWLTPASAADQAAAAPRLRLTGMTGALRVQPPNQMPYPVNGIPESGLPYIQPGTKVDVVSGEASFESDNHATIRAQAGSGFLFTAPAATAESPQGLRVTAIGGGPATEVNVAGSKLLLTQGGTVAIGGSGSGWSSVVIEGGGVAMAPSILHEGESLTLNPRANAASAMTPGDTLRLIVPAQRGFASRPLNVANLRTAAVQIEAAEGTTAAALPAQAAGDKMTAAEKKAAAGDRAKEIVQSWPADSKLVAEVMMEKYGAPQRASAGKLIWLRNGQWKRTTVFRDQANALKQTVGYEIPAGKTKDVAAFDSTVSLQSEMSAQSNSEALNCLTLNLADEIVRGKKEAVEARSFYDSTVRLSYSGKSSPYMEKLLFVPEKKQPMVQSHRQGKQ